MTSDASSMASEEKQDMPDLSSQNLTRPVLLSQQSSSVPATPRQHARHLSNNGRSPSPTAAFGSHSPRSVSSEALRQTSGYRPTNPACRFQSTQTSRRRVPYTIGADMLGPMKEEPRKNLTPSEEESLSADMKRLYDGLLPSQSSQESRWKVVDKLRNILRDEWPERNVEVSVFGSSGNLLYTNKSDVDVCITMRDFDTVCNLAEVLSRRGMKNVTCVHAKAVPIVKIWDPELQVACDLNVNNHVALKNTRLVRAYMEIDSRVRPLAMIVKYWTKRRVINEASGGTLSSYTWTLLVINFLQTRHVPILPVLLLKDEQGRPKEDFTEDLRIHRDFGKANHETLGELFFHFFRRYGHEIDYETDVMSVRRGQLLTKHEKHWVLANNNRLCVEEPFNTDRNLGNTADDTAFRGLHLELRQAFARIAEAKDLVTSICEQFEFPVEEHKPIFERPQPMPRPVLSRSASQSGRGNRLGPNKRGNRQQFDHRSGANARRSSSAAAFGYNAPQVFQSPQVVLHSNEHLLQQEELSRLSRKMSQEEQQLRMRQIQIMQAQQAMGAIPGRGANSPLPTPPRQLFNNGYPSPRMPTNDPNASHTVTVSGYPFPASYDVPATMSHSSSQQGTSTNPTSPMLGPTTPNRRGFQRNTALNSPGTTVRSQSQPARPLQPQIIPQGSLRPQYPQMVYPPMQGTGMWPSHLPRPAYYGPYMGPYGGYYMAVPYTENLPREYLGYGIGTGSQIVQHAQDLNYSQAHVFEDARRREGQSSPTRQPLSLPLSAAEAPRSSSPLARGDLSTNGLRSAPINGTFAAYQLPEQPAPRRSQDSEPIIVNGSYPMPGMSQPARIDEPPGQAGLSDSPSLSHALSDSPSAESGFGYQNQRSRTPTHQSSNRFPLSHGGNTATAVNESASLGFSQTEKVSESPVIARGSTEMLPPPRPVQSVAGNRTSFTQRSPDIVNGSGWSNDGSKQSIPPLDLGTAADRVRDNVPKTSMILSPVEETRTPSPINNKKQGNRKSVQMNGLTVPIPPTPGPTKGEKSDAQKETGNANVGKKGGGGHGRNSSLNTIGAASSMSLPGQWQSAATGKKKGKKRNQSQSPGAEKKKGGEPLPTNETARKGG